MDRAGEFPAIGDVNDEIRRLRLAAYAPLRYVLPHRQAAYDSRYSTSIRGGESVFRQADREESLIHLMRVNLLKRMESSVASFRLTLGRQLAAVENLLERIDNHEPDVDEPDIEEVDFDDPEMESLLVGRRVKVLLSDVDRIKWRQDLREDRDRLMYLLAVAKNVLPPRTRPSNVCREVDPPLVYVFVMTMSLSGVGVGQPLVPRLQPLRHCGVVIAVLLLQSVVRRVNVLEPLLPLLPLNLRFFEASGVPHIADDVVM